MKKNILLSTIVIAALALSGCADKDEGTPEVTPGGGGANNIKTISGDISSNRTLTAGTTWILDGLVQVKPGVTLTIEPGTTVAGKTASWLLVEAGATIIADGTPTKKITFTSEQATLGEVEASAQWGGVSIIGNSNNALLAGGYEVHTATGAMMAGTGDASSGIIDNVIINNAGVTIRPGQEVNGLNLFGVSASTTVSNLSLDRIGDDGVGIQGGSVNLTNVSIKNAENDGFDVEGGWNGTMDGLTVINPTFAGIEVSEYPVPTIRNATLNVSGAASQGGIFFATPKGTKAGAHFENIAITHNAPVSGGIAVQGVFDQANTSFKNVTITGSNKDIVARTAGDTIEETSRGQIQAMFDAQATTTTPRVTLSGDISANRTLTADTIWILDGLVQVKPGATLTIEPGTTVAGRTASWLLVEAGATLIADGTPTKKITFTSEQATLGEVEASAQWGGVSIIGNSDNPLLAGGYEVHTATGAMMAGTGDASSGIIDNVVINNAGVTIRPSQEVNGLNLFGVSASTIVSNLSLDRIGDDGVGIQGGSVNLTNVSILNAENDGFDVEGGWNGTMDGLIVTNPTFAGIEVSEYPVPTIRNATLNVSGAASQGGIFFATPKGTKAGAHFENITVTHNAPVSGGIAVQGVFDQANTSFKNVTINGTRTAIVARTAGDTVEEAGRDQIQAMFDAQRTATSPALPTQILSGDISANRTLTADTIWILDGLVQVKPGATLTIEAGTTVAGRTASWLLVEAGATLIADGTPANRITFTSEQATLGEVEASAQWGGVSIIGNSNNPLLAGGYEVHTAAGAMMAGTGDASSGIIDNVDINNAGVTIRPSQEVNGLNLFGVSASTTVSNLRLDRIGDDGVGIQGGSVNLTNVSILNAENDGFDVEGGWNGTMDGLVVVNPTFAGIEVSEFPVPTIRNATLDVSGAASQGGIFFATPKGTKAGAHFENITVTHNAPVSGGIAVQGVFDNANTSFNNVIVSGTRPAIVARTAGDAVEETSRGQIQTMFDAQP